MNTELESLADKLVDIMMELPMVNSCAVYGSLTTGKADHMSDIDLEVDVSGCDNGQFMLELPELLKDKLPVVYFDFAPSMIPDKYIVSLAIDENNPFRMVDLCCTAIPHCTTVTRQNATLRNSPHTHLLKLWTANLKHYARGRACRDDIVRMARKAGIPDAETKSEYVLLSETLVWLEQNAAIQHQGITASCRCVFDQQI